MSFAHSWRIGNTRSAGEPSENDAPSSTWYQPPQESTDSRTGREGLLEKIHHRQGPSLTPPKTGPTQEQHHVSQPLISWNTSIRWLARSRVTGSGFCAEPGPSLVSIEGQRWMLLISELLGPSLEQRQLFILMGGTDVIT